jgi:hypothetical protein
MEPRSPTKPRFTFFKVAALVCSIVLVGAYVTYRGGGALMPSTKSGRVVSPAGDVEAPRERVMMPSSKSGPITPPPPTAQSERTLMPGSKSMVLTEPGKPIAQQPATQTSGK